MRTHDRQRPSTLWRIAPAAALLGISAMIFPSVYSQSRPGSERSEAISRLKSIQPESSRTCVLILATFHLKQIAGTFKPGLLDSLMTRLEKFKPDAICIEALPGSRVSEIELRRSAGPLYSELLDGFAARHLKMGKRALDILGTTQPAAGAKVRELLAVARASGPKRTAAAERAALALWMLAAYEPDSAALQWTYLSENEKKTQKALPPDLAAALEAESAKVNEVPAIAARLARKLGLESLDAVDDFEDLVSYAEITLQLEKDIQSSPLLASVAKASVYTDAAARLEACIRKGDLLSQFVLLNSAGYAAADVEAQWGAFLRTRFASGSDRGRLGLWENRNLKIAARIRAVAALHPGGRILVVYGAAHKPFLEAYLERTADVRLVTFDELEAR